MGGGEGGVEAGQHRKMYTRSGCLEGKKWGYTKKNLGTHRILNGGDSWRGKVCKLLHEY